MQRGKVVLRVLSLLTQRKAALSFNICRQLVQGPFVPLLVRPLSFSSRIMAYKTVEKGTLNSTSYRIYFTDEDCNPISPFHDIPLYANEENKIFNMVVEIPRWTNSKMEINKIEKLNPIKQDVKNNAVRFVKNCFPHHGYIWNYGALPQTWEDPGHVDERTNAKGDCDPIDVCEIGQTVHKRGAVIQVKALGMMALLDEGETDWKVLCIDVNDPIADKLNDIEDIEREMPGFIKATREWFTVYKIPDKKPANKFAFDGEAKNRDFALNIIQETHEQWKELLEGKKSCDDISCANVKVAGSPHKIDVTEANEIIAQAGEHSKTPDLLPADVDRWHYIPSSAL